MSGSVVAEVPREVGQEVRALKKALAPQVGRRTVAPLGIHMDLVVGAMGW